MSANKIINSNVNKEIEDKIFTLKEIINESFSSMQSYKIMDVINGNELNEAINNLEEFYNNLTILNKKILLQNDLDYNNIFMELNRIKEELLLLFSNSGTKHFNKLVDLLFDGNVENIENLNIEKYNILSKYAHPINFKILNWKTYSPLSSKNKKYIQKNKIIDEQMIIENSENLECFDLSRTHKTFQIKVYGIKVILHDPKKKLTYSISCLVDDILITCLDVNYIKEKIEKIDLDISSEKEFNNNDWTNFKKFLTLKDILILIPNDIINKYNGIISQINYYKQKNISQIVNEFLNSDLYIQRNILINLLVKSNDCEYQYICYLLYDLLSNENQGNIDTIEQTMLYDSLPWHCKTYFKNAMKQTINYTNQLCNYDESKIPFEQQICLMKANNNVKEKAMLKLKEVKAKSEDTGSKARQYLDGLLKIPFGLYKEEYILTLKKELNLQFESFFEKVLLIDDKNKFTKKNIYTVNEMKLIIDYVKNNLLPLINSKIKENYIQLVKKDKKPELIKINNSINEFVKINNINYKKLTILNKKVDFLQENIIDFVNYLKDSETIISYLKNITQNIDKLDVLIYFQSSINDILNNINKINNYMKNVKENLDTCVYGHSNAKEQVETIIAQWINGENSGYCFGFEGPPGVGKTSLAKKGISKCLQDNNGISRPFSFIAIGGSSNGSTLEGHNYTYVGSTWGKIVDILMEKKCMNPIIFIDELDKISKTEHGKEIIGILTHLIDYTQNDSFQDKYFNGIDLDLSKVLFIFSYNDVDSIDRILLDRIHRIKFKHLSLEEKITITQKFLLPELYKKVGFENLIEFDEETLIKIINNYTCEPGVRKLKEILFEIIGKINLEILNDSDKYNILPIKINYDDVKNFYLKERHEINIKNIIENSSIGIINGLWANSLGQGGLLYIEVKEMLSSSLMELKLTGMQGDVMKESMNVAKTVAIQKYLENNLKEELIEKYKNTGFHIHVPEGATPKDGPSAGTAITTAVYSILSGRKINKLFAITGEISLQGLVTEIGGLDLKILGGIKSGAKKFIFPKSNNKDFDDFYSKYENKKLIENIEFFPVETIDQVFDLIFID